MVCRDKPSEPCVWTNGDGLWIRGAIRGLPASSRSTPTKIRALLDRSVSTPIRVFESGAILVYLAEMFGAFLPTDRPARECGRANRVRPERCGVSWRPLRLAYVWRAHKSRQTEIVSPTFGTRASVDAPFSPSTN